MKTISSARAATDTRHRIKDANSKPRRIKMIGLANGGAAIVQALNSATLREVQPIVDDGGADVLQQLDGAEMIFVVACNGDDMARAPEVKAIARAANVMITGILIQDAAGPDTSQADLPILRAASDMLIVVSDPTYVNDMLAQLGA